jgi:hypothetical protein
LSNSVVRWFSTLVRVRTVGGHAFVVSVLSLVVVLFCSGLVCWQIRSDHAAGLAAESCQLQPQRRSSLGPAQRERVPTGRLRGAKNC